MIRVIVIVAVMMLAANPVAVCSCENPRLEQLFNPQEQKLVIEGKILTTAYLENHRIFSNHQENVTLETLALPDGSTTDFSSYELLAVEKAFIPYTPNAENLLTLFNKLTAYSELSGMNYYSRTDNRLQPYILSSFRIDSPVNAVFVNDEKHAVLPSDYTAYVVLEDNRFGKLLMRNKISLQNHNITICHKTVEPMSKWLIPINKPGENELQMWLIYDDTAKGYFYYSMQAMRIRSQFLLKISQLTPDNVANRIRAMTVHLAGLMGHDWKDRMIASR